MRAPEQSRWPVLVVALVVMLAAGACQDLPEREVRGPSDAGFNQGRAAAEQDSLLRTLGEDAFVVMLTPDPYDPSKDADAVRRDFSGHATFETIDARGNEPAMIRFTLHGPRQMSVHLTWETTQDSAGVLLRPTAGDSLTITQALEGRRPTVHAAMDTRRQRFRSRSGTLKLTEISEDRVRGSFFFEMQSPDLGEEDWFELVGAFDAARTS